MVIEHNLQVLSYADWIIEMGEKGGREGGKIIFEGKVSELTKTKTPTAKEIKKWQGFND